MGAPASVQVTLGQGTKLPMDDVHKVAQATGVNLDKAKRALERAEGRVCVAISDLEGGE